MSRFLPSCNLLCILKSTKADFIPPMSLLRTERLPEGPNWLCELKLDSYRAIAAKAEGRVHLWSRNERILVGDIRAS